MMTIIILSPIPNQGVIEYSLPKFRLLYITVGMAGQKTNT